MHPSLRKTPECQYIYIYSYSTWALTTHVHITCIIHSLCQLFGQPNPKPQLFFFYLPWAICVTKTRNIRNVYDQHFDCRRPRCKTKLQLKTTQWTGIRAKVVSWIRSSMAQPRRAWCGLLPQRCLPFPFRSCSTEARNTQWESSPLCKERRTPLAFLFLCWPILLWGPLFLQIHQLFESGYSPVVLAWKPSFPFLVACISYSVGATETV